LQSPASTLKFKQFHPLNIYLLLFFPPFPFTPFSLPLAPTPPSFFFYTSTYYTPIQFFISNKSLLFSQITCLLLMPKIPFLSEQTK